MLIGRRNRILACAALALALLPFSFRHSTLELGLSLLLALVLSALAVVDLDTFRLPDVLTLPLIAIGILLVPPLSTHEIVWRAAAAAVAYLLLFAVAEGYRRWRGQAGLGLGDAKLFAAAGAWVSLSGLSLVLLLACLSALATIGYKGIRGQAIDRFQMIPFGPFLALGFWLTWLFGDIA